jgi:hypothetical protein
MIKNNFIVTEEEKQHILNLTRLPNYKKPVRLKEQYSAVITDTPPAPTSTGGESNTGTFDISNESKELKDKQINGGFGDMDFNRKSDEVGGAYEHILGLIQNYSRGRVFGMFKEALEMAGKIYPNKKYDGTSYTDMAKQINNQINTVASEVQKVQQLRSWNSLTDPTPEELSLYFPRRLDAPFEGVRFYELKDQYMSAEALGTNNAKGPTNSFSSDTDNDSITLNQANKKTNQEAKKGLLGFLQKSSSNTQDTLTDNLCLDILQSYINDIIPGTTTLTDKELSTTKRTIALCNTRKSSELKTNIFGKVKNKTTGNAYRNLTKKFRQELENLSTRPDKFKINLTEPDKN